MFFAGTRFHGNSSPLTDKGMQKTLGILMLDTEFIRPVGDMGNPDSWPFPVLLERVSGARARATVEGTNRAVKPFLDAAQILIERGAGCITTTCGFLVRHQQVLAAALPVPVATSSLLQYETIQRSLGPFKYVGILSVQDSALDADTRRCANIPMNAAAFSLPQSSHFVRAILDGSEPLRPVIAEQEWINFSQVVHANNPDIGAWLLECANMPPYSHAISLATGLPVYDGLTLGCQLQADAWQ